MEALNLEAADKYRRERPLDNNGTPPAAAESVPADPVLLLLKRNRAGLALAFSVMFPGLGQVFMGSYIAAPFYAAAWVLCVFRAVSPLFAAFHPHFAWGWAIGALIAWAASIVHTVVALGIED